MNETQRSTKNKACPKCIFILHACVHDSSMQCIGLSSYTCLLINQSVSTTACRHTSHTHKVIQQLKIYPYTLPTKNKCRTSETPGTGACTIVVTLIAQSFSGFDM